MIPLFVGNLELELCPGSGELAETSGGPSLRSLELHGLWLEMIGHAWLGQLWASSSPRKHARIKLWLVDGNGLGLQLALQL